MHAARLSREPRALRIEWIYFCIGARLTAEARRGGTDADWEPLRDRDEEAEEDDGGGHAAGYSGRRGRRWPMSATTSPRALAAAAPPLDGALGGPLAPLALPAAALAAASAASAAAGGGAGEKARRRHTTGLNPDDGYASAVAAPTLARDDALPRPPRSRMGSTAGGVDTRIGIERLPWEVLVEIFSYLDLRSVVQGAQVSRRWRAIAADNWLWQQVRGPATRPPCRIHALPHRRPVPWAHVTSGRGMRAGGAAAVPPEAMACARAAAGSTCGQLALSLSGAGAAAQVLEDKHRRVSQHPHQQCRLRFLVVGRVRERANRLMLSCVVA